GSKHPWPPCCQVPRNNWPIRHKQRWRRLGRSRSGKLPRLVLRERRVRQWNKGQFESAIESLSMLFVLIQLLRRLHIFRGCVDGFAEAVRVRSAGWYGAVIQKNS